MYQDAVVLCGSSAYEQKYYLNDIMNVMRKIRNLLLSIRKDYRYFREAQADPRAQEALESLVLEPS